MVKFLQEGLGGIRDVLVNGTQPYYCKLYSDADTSFRRASADNVFISGSPRYIMEGIGITFIAIMAYSISRSGGIEAAIPVLGAFAVGARKCSQPFNKSTLLILIKGANDSTIDVLELLDQPLPTSFEKNDNKLFFNKNIIFKSVYFRYSDTSTYVLNDINLEFNKGDKIGIVGSTGTGKSTLIDLLMGLLKPTSGVILVDGVKISDSNRSKWHSLISHVPQNIFLSDSTIKENIAFGCNPDLVDESDVKKAAKKAIISNTIDKLLHKYESFVGERGVQLSGGQRQRIGIARSLQKQ